MTNQSRYPAPTAASSRRRCGARRERPARSPVTSEVLPAIRKTGQYVAQPYAHNPGDTLSLDQADTLRKLLTDAAKQRHPGDGKQQGAFLMRGWSKLKAHFKRGYREIPQAEFAEAVSLVARHIAEQGELIEEATQPAADMVSKAHAMRCFDLAGALASGTRGSARFESRTPVTARHSWRSSQWALWPCSRQPFRAHRRTSYSATTRSRNNSRSVFCPPRSTCFTDWLNWSIRRPIWMSISRCCS